MPISQPDSSPHRAQAPARMHWMDMLRGIAVLLVVILHGADIPYLNGNGVEQWAEVNRYLEPFRMPLLMFLSGMLMPRSLAKTLPVYLWGKFAAIVWPLVLWGLLFGLLIYRGGIDDPAFWRSGGDYLWFLTALTICYLIGALLTPAAHRITILVTLSLAIFVSMLVLRHLGLTDLPLITRTLYNGAFFFLGAACFRAVPLWLRTPGLIVAVLAVIAGVISYLGIDDRALRTGTLYAVPGSVLGIAVAIWVAARIPKSRLLDALAWVGRSSIVVYIIHFPAAVLCHRLMVSLQADPVTHTIACTIAGLAASLAAVAMRPYTPWLYVFPRGPQVQARLTQRATAAVRSDR